MLVLAQAIVSRPRYILADELSFGLAPVIVARLVPVLESFAASGVGVLLIEQFTHIALRISQHAYVMERGRIRFSGEPDELLAKPGYFAQRLPRQLNERASMSGRFVDRSVLVTGAGSSGIGRATAQLFAAEGGRVVVVDQNEADAEKTVALIRDAGGRRRLPWRRHQPGSQLPGHGRTRCIAAYGQSFNVAFNNAGVGSASGFAVADEEEVAWSRLIDVNLEGHLSVHEI